MQHAVFKHKITRYGVITGLFLFGPLFVSLTDPTNMALPLLVIPFLWLFVSLALTCYYFIGFSQKVTKRQRILISVLVALTPVILLLFQSLHQLTIRDFLLSVGLVAVAAFYMLRADFIK